MGQMCGTRRFFPLLAILLLLPLGLFGCDAGDGGGDPSGPSTQYTPGMDLPGATLTARLDRGGIAPGDEFVVVANFRDANGVPVEGIPVGVYAEAGSASAPYFTFLTNPSLTDREGYASIGVIVSPGCPSGSYTLVVQTASPFIRTFVHFGVSGEGTAAVLSVTLTTPTSTVTLPGNATFVVDLTTTAGCTPVVEASYAGAGVNPSPGFAMVDYPTFSLTPQSPGTLTVVVRAYCDGTDPSTAVVSSPVNVTVTD